MLDALQHALLGQVIGTVVVPHLLMRGNNNEGESMSWVRVNERVSGRTRILGRSGIYLESHPFEFEVDGIGLTAVGSLVTAQAGQRQGQTGQLLYTAGQTEYRVGVPCRAHTNLVAAC